MPPSRPPYKRRRSGSHHSISSKRTTSASSTHSTARSARTGASRRSSGSSLQGYSGRQRASRDISERPASSVDTRAYTGVATGIPGNVSQASRDEYPDIEMLSEVIMAVNLTDRGAIGCAYYVAQTETLYFMEDVQMGDSEMVDSCTFTAISRRHPRKADQAQ